ncbi:BTB/POZ domain-containing protein 3-like [Dendronephthya gigantea]|uniref:BTB/POZ domain-containing protein 3-like n=1 Tax=Dendronephthya gigantea TaxID=151771 RepID=UPI001068E48C|nr:BTB/POZ domain-containing protein 3-like [Dendronephthya gigantea]
MFCWLSVFTLATGFLCFVHAEQSSHAASHRVENVEWTPIKAKDVEKMYNNTFMSDIKLTFGKKPENVFYAHKYVLALSSPVFHDMFYRKDAKPVQTIRLSYDRDNLAGFLSYIYKDDCPTIHDKSFNTLELMIKYKVHLHPDCHNSLKRSTETQTAFKFVEKFLELNAEAFAEICLNKIDALAEDYFASKHFLNIKQSTLKVLLDRDTLYLNETDIFKAVLKWADRQLSPETNRAENRRRVLGNAIYSIRFLLMTQGVFTKDVISTNILQDNEAMDIIRLMNGKRTKNTVWDTKKIKRERHRGQFHGVIEDSAADEKISSSWTNKLKNFVCYPFRLAYSRFYTTVIGLIILISILIYFEKRR